MASPSNKSSESSDTGDVQASGMQRHETEATSRRAKDVSVEPKKKGKKTDANAATTVSLPAFVTDPNNPIGWMVTSTQEFASDSVRLVRRCTKPDAREFKKIAFACAIGFLLMGFIGYAVKLVFIPINNIIVGG